MSNVTVEINGRETVSQAALQASGSVKKMSDDSKKFLSDITVTAGDVVNAVRGIASTVTEFVTLYAEQQKAVTNLNTAIEMSDKVSKDSTAGLIEFASELQALTGIGDETTIALEAMLIASGRNEQQTRQLIKAAADYSAATGKDFKASVEELNKSFSGSEGRLGMIIPELKELTDEELKSGAALDIVTSKYGGFSEKLADTASVALASFNASWGDMKESLGEAIMPAVLPILQGLVEFLNNPVIPTIQGFAPIVKEVFQNVQQFIKELKPAIEPIINWFAEVWTKTIGPNIKSIGTILKETLKLVSGIINGDWKRVWDSFKTIVTSVIDILKRAFEPLINFINKIVDGITKAVDFVKGLTKGKGGPVPDNFFDISVPGLATGTSGAKKGWAMVGEEGPELVFFNGGEEVVPNHKIGGYAAGTLRGGSSAEGADSGGGAGLSIIEELAGVLKPVIDQFGGMIKSLASVQDIMNPIQTILQAAMDVLGPLINSILAPIVGILRIVGNTLGQILAPALSILGPIVKLVGDIFVWMYNTVMRPVGNALITAFNFLYNSVMGLVNGLIKAYNAVNNIWHPFNHSKGDINEIAYRSLDQGYISEIDAGQLSAAGATSYTSQSYTGTTGASASYQRPRDITVNVQVNTSALVGDDGVSQFALIIGRELKAAGVLGIA